MKLENLPLKRRFSRRKWLLLQHEQVKCPLFGNIRVPVGFVFDGATVPRIFWAFMNPVGWLFYASLFHDHALKIRGIMRPNGEIEPLSDAEIDKMFYKLCRHTGVDWLTANVAYIGVRLGSLFRSRK